MTNIRDATLEDIPELIQLGLDFHKEANLSWFAEVDVSSWEATIEAMVTKDPHDAIFVVAEDEEKIVGMLCAIIVPWYANFHHLLAHELVMYVDEQHRAKSIGGQLLSAFEERAIEKGVNGMLVGAKTEMRIEKMTKAYARRGYRELERYYVKRA